MLVADANHYLNSIAPIPLTRFNFAPAIPSSGASSNSSTPAAPPKTASLVTSWAKPGATESSCPADGFVEASSGSTSIAMALVCAQLGARFLAVMPEGVSNERVLIIRAYGGEVRFSHGAAGVLGAIAESQRLAVELGAFLPRQFENQENADAHRLLTAPEILSQVPGGRVDAIVSGSVGTGGTLVGLYEGLVTSNAALRPVLARPVEGAVMRDVECCSFLRLGGVQSPDSGSGRLHLRDLSTSQIPRIDRSET